MAEIISDKRLQQLIVDMEYKAQNIKARFEPSEFEDVANALKDYQSLREEYSKIQF